MLTLKEPIQLHSQRGMISVSDSFGKKVAGNYGLMSAHFTPKDLLFAITTPVEFPEDMGGMTTIAVQHNTTDMRTVTLDVVTNVVNRILLSSTPTFTYQDQVYITSVLNKLGITDVQQFMTQVHQLREDNISTATLINLYQQELKRLKKGEAATTQEPAAKQSVPTTQTEAQPAQHPRHYLHDTIYERLQTAQVYHTVNSFQRNQVDGAQVFRNQELRTAEQLRISQSITLQELKQQVNYGDAISLRHHINRYELGDILPPPVTQEQVYQQASAAALLTAVDNITLQAIDHSLHRNDLWLNLTQAISQSAENTLTRFERYHSEESAQFIEHQSYTHTLRELRREEIGWLKALYQRETSLYIEGAAATLVAPQLPPPVAMTHTDITVSGDVVEGDTNLHESQQVVQPSVDITQIQMALAGQRPPTPPVTPTPSPSIETVHRHTQQDGDTLITSHHAENTLHHLMFLERELTHLVQEPSARLTPQVIEPLIAHYTTNSTTTTPMDSMPAPHMPTVMDSILAQIAPTPPDQVLPSPTPEGAVEQNITLIHQQGAPLAHEEDTPLPTASNTTVVLEETKAEAQVAPQQGQPPSLDLPTTPTQPVSPRDVSREVADPLALIHQTVEAATVEDGISSPAMTLAATVVGKAKEQMARQEQIANYFTALTTSTQVDIHHTATPSQEEMQQFLSADMAMPPVEVDDVTLLQQLDEINQRNITLHKMVQAQKATAQPPTPTVADKTRTMDDAFRSLTDPQQVLQELAQAEVRQPKRPPLPPAAMVALQQADPATREVYEKILRYYQDPSSATEDGILKPASIGTLNAEAARVAHQQINLTHQTQVLTQETERHSTQTKVLLEHLAEQPVQQMPPPTQSRPRPAVHMIHKQEESLISEELLEQLQTKQVNTETTQVVHQQVNHETVQQTDVHNLSKQVVTQATEDITALVNRTMSRQLGTITDKVYQQMEKKLQTERYRRGRF